MTQFIDDKTSRIFFLELSQIKINKKEKVFMRPLQSYTLYSCMENEIF
jgi:hypothetical protein